MKLFKEFNYVIYNLKKRISNIYICKKGFDLTMDI